MWGGQGNDITSQLERRDWMRKNLTGSSIKDTTSSPATAAPGHHGDHGAPGAGGWIVNFC